MKALGDLGVDALANGPCASISTFSCSAEEPESAPLDPTVDVDKHLRLSDLKSVSLRGRLLRASEKHLFSDNALTHVEAGRLNDLAARQRESMRARGMKEVVAKKGPLCRGYKRRRVLLPNSGQRWSAVFNGLTTMDPPIYYSKAEFIETVRTKPWHVYCDG